MDELSHLSEGINDLISPHLKIKDSANASAKLTGLLKDSKNGFAEIFFVKIQFMERAQASGLAIYRRPSMET